MVHLIGENRTDIHHYVLALGLLMGAEAVAVLVESPLIHPFHAAQICTKLCNTIIYNAIRLPNTASSLTPPVRIGAPVVPN